MVRIDNPNYFEAYDDDHIRTLSAHGASAGHRVGGLLYVPDVLFSSDPCHNVSMQYVPSNATRRADLPANVPSLIALIPWLSPGCTLSFLDAAAPETKAYMTYIPNDGTEIPPPANNETWDLHDGGRWKSRHNFPVYALPGAEGGAIMQQLGQYTGNSTSSSLIREILFQTDLDPSDYVRLFTVIDTGASNSLPSLWAFLLIVLCMAVVLIGSLSFTMHWVQRRRRRDLQRRIDNGEVDLETLGIKRMRITQEAIDALPLLIYTSEPPPSTDQRSNITLDPSSTIPSQPPAPLTTTVTQTSHTHTQFSQPACPICLEDFIPNTTTIRTLPCHHIYHPECIDPFLTNNSSLCPICKARVPSTTSASKTIEPVTNAMVRRERLLRQRAVQNRNPRSPPEEGGGWLMRVRGMGRRNVHAPNRPSVAPTTSQIEMGVVEDRPVQHPSTVDRDVRPRSLSRVPERTADEEEAEIVARTPRCELLFPKQLRGFCKMLTSVC